MELRPLPEDLINTLAENERVALDLLLERLPLDDRDTRNGNWAAPATADMLGLADQQTLRDLIPNAHRRGAVITTARQLRQLGVTIRPRREHAE
jgi:hypothetical protein